MSNQAIVHLFVEVVELTGENLLLNADGGPGGVGARLTLPIVPRTPFEPGASSTFEFRHRPSAANRSLLCQHARGAANVEFALSVCGESENLI